MLKFVQNIEMESGLNLMYEWKQYINQNVFYTFSNKN